MAIGSSWFWKPPRGGATVEGGSGRKRTESGEEALLEPFGGVGLDGFRSFAFDSSRYMRNSSSRQIKKGAPSLWCSS